ncbi:MAG: HEAT repeat domain-containing protein [Firmicutes bacterium]|nr:HEAT repeat domain-containing protein [Bacillota bacterium]
MSKKRSKTSRAAEFPALAERLLETVTWELKKENPDYRLITAQITGFPIPMASPVLERLARSMPQAVLPLLAELVNHENDGLVQLAVEALGQINQPESITILARLEEELLGRREVDAKLKKAVSRSQHRLKSAGIIAALSAVTEKTAQISSERQYHQSHLSTSDGKGTTQVVLALRSPGGKLETAIVLLNDAVGIVQTRLYTFNQRQYENYLGEWNPEVLGIRMVEVERDFINHLVHRHLAINKRENRTLPHEFLHWQRYFEAPKGDYSIHPVYQRIPPEGIRDSLRLLLPQTERLAQAPEVRHWLFDPAAIRGAAERLLERKRSRIVLTNTSQAEYIVKLARESIEAIFDQGYLARYIERLENLAYVLLLSDQAELARLALATAIDLKGGAPSRNPFLVSLAVKSLESLVEMLESGDGPPDNLGVDLSAT